MIRQEVVEEVLSKLYDIGAEPAIVYRRNMIKNYYITTKEKENTEATELLDIILSFQVDEILKDHKPKFNTMSSVLIEEDIARFFVSPYKNTFYSLPYISQQLIYTMTSSRTLSLSLQDISDIPFSYMNPFAWITKYSIDIIDETSRCHLCGVPEDGELCESCINTLNSFTEFRHEPFKLCITNDIIALPNKNYGDFSYAHNQYKISRDGINSVSYDINIGHKIQLELPIVEYQRKLSLN